MAKKATSGTSPFNTLFNAMPTHLKIKAFTAGMKLFAGKKMTASKRKEISASITAMFGVMIEGTVDMLLDIWVEHGHEIEPLLQDSVKFYKEHEESIKNIVETIVAHNRVLSGKVSAVGEDFAQTAMKPFTEMDNEFEAWAEEHPEASIEEFREFIASLR